MKIISQIMLWLGGLLFGIWLGMIINVPAKPDIKAEKLQLEIQHLKYQVGIDSLRYDLELNFYEKRHVKN